MSGIFLISKIRWYFNDPLVSMIRWYFNDPLVFQ
jgi:hypothetical protein